MTWHLVWHFVWHRVRVRLGPENWHARDSEAVSVSVSGYPGCLVKIYRETLTWQVGKRLIWSCFPPTSFWDSIWLNVQRLKDESCIATCWKLPVANLCCWTETWDVLKGLAFGTHPNTCQKDKLNAKPVSNHSLSSLWANVILSNLTCNSALFRPCSLWWCAM